MKKILLNICMMFALGISSFSLTVGPIYFNQRIDGQGGYQEYEVDNPSFSTARYKIKVTPETSDAKLKKEMEKWVEVYPKVLTVQPKGLGKVKVLIKAPSNTKVGEYSYMMSIVPIKVPTLEDKKDTSKLSKISGITATLSLMMGLNCYVGNLGDIHKDVEIKKVDSKDGIKLSISNTMKREIALDLLVLDNITRYRDILKIKAGEKFEKLYTNAKKIEIKEAPTEIELKTIY